MPRRNRSAESTLSLTQSALPVVVKGVSASNSISFLHFLSVDKLLKPVADSISLVSEASISPIIHVSIASNLSLDQDAESDGTKHVAPSSIIELTHLAHSSLHGESVVSQLDLQQSGSVSKPVDAAAVSFLQGELEVDALVGVDLNSPEAIEELFEGIGLRQDVSLGTVLNLSVTSYLSLSQVAAKAAFESVTSTLNLTSVAESIFHRYTSNTLYFQQAATGFTGYSAESELDLTHTIGVTGVVPGTPSSQLTLNDAVSFIIVNFCDYAPGIGAGSLNYTPPSPIAPTLVRRGTTVLTHPYTSPLTTVPLRNPNFDNVTQLEFRRINRRTKGGSLDLYRDETWPKVTRLIYTFTWLSELQKNQLLAFLNSSLGAEIGILDFESRQWRGVILTPSSAVSEPKVNGFSASFEFEGELA
jgi:hypothetical protein